MFIISFKTPPSAETGERNILEQLQKKLMQALKNIFADDSAEFTNLKVSIKPSDKYTEEIENKTTGIINYICK